MNSSTEPVASVPDLVREIVGDARELVQLELALAKRDALAELTRARTAAIAVAVAALASTIAITMALVAIALVTAAPALVAGVAAAVFVVVALVSIQIARKKAPTNLLGETKLRIERDVKQIEERGAWITAPTKNP